jgi:hypothetical protein
MNINAFGNHLISFTSGCKSRCRYNISLKKVLLRGLGFFILALSNPMSDG